MSFGIDDHPVFVIDQSRCIGCEACVQACAECGTHRGQSLIHLERIDRATTTQTAPMVCMHCEDPTCAQVCPADAIKQTEEGIVQSALKPRCIGCSNCVLACPFGVPKYVADFDQMMKCDMCNDRTSEGLTPMCASVCPSEALWYGTIEEFNDTRRGSLFRDFMFGRQQVRTKVYTVVDDSLAGPLALGSSTVMARRSVRTRRPTDMNDHVEPVPVAPPWKRDFPYEARLEEEVTRREFARYLVLGAGAMAAANVGFAVWAQLRSINSGEPRAFTNLDSVEVGGTFLFRYPGNDDPAILLRLGDTDVIAFSQKCTHLGRVVYYDRRAAMALPVNEATSRPAPAQSSRTATRTRTDRRRDRDDCRSEAREAP
jgi:Fe-S-cluster-containing dehydrogenase component